MSNYFTQTEGVWLWALPYDFQVLTDARNPWFVMSSEERKSGERWRHMVRLTQISTIVGVHAIGSKSWGCFCTLLKLGNCIKSHKHGRFQREERSFGALIMRNFQVWVKGSGTNERAFSSACIAPIFAHIPENKPKTSTIEQIETRWEPKISPLQRVTLQ